MSKYASHKGVLYAICSGLCYGFIGYFGMTIINSGLSVSCMSFWRFFISTLFVALTLVFNNNKPHVFSKSTLKLLLAGVGLYGVSTIAYFVSSKYIGTGLAMVTFFVFPAIVILINVLFYKAAINSIYYFASAFIIIGMICLVDSSSLNFNVLGLAIGLLSSVLYAFYIVVSKRIVSNSPIVSTLMVSLGCTITSVIATILDSSFFIPNELNVWFNIASMAIFCTAMPILLLMQSLKYISSEKSAMLSVLEPVFVVLCGIFLLDEQVTSFQIIGIVAVLAGAILVILPYRQKNHNQTILVAATDE